MLVSGYANTCGTKCALSSGCKYYTALINEKNNNNNLCKIKNTSLH